MPRGHGAKLARKYTRAAAKGKLSTSISQSGSIANHGKRTYKHKQGDNTKTLTLPLTFEGRFYKIDMILIKQGDTLKNISFTSVKYFPNPADPSTFRLITGCRSEKTLVRMLPAVNKQVEVRGYAVIPSTYDKY